MFSNIPVVKIADITRADKAMSDLLEVGQCKRRLTVRLIGWIWQQMQAPRIATLHVRAERGV
jgi:hypothetical protein